MQVISTGWVVSCWAGTNWFRVRCGCWGWASAICASRMDSNWHSCRFLQNRVDVSSEPPWVEMMGACPDLLTPERVDALMVLFFLQLHELGAKDTESQLTVLELRTLGLRADQQAGGKELYMDGSVALVPILSATPRTTPRG